VPNRDERFEPVRVLRHQDIDRVRSILHRHTSMVLERDDVAQCPTVAPANVRRRRLVNHRRTVPARSRPIELEEGSRQATTTRW